MGAELGEVCLDSPLNPHHHSRSLPDPLRLPVLYPGLRGMRGKDADNSDQTDIITVCCSLPTPQPSHLLAL